MPATPLSNIDAVLFDAVGTLLRPDPPVGMVYHAAGAQHGSRLTPEEVLARFQGAFARGEAQDADRKDGLTNESLERARWRRIVAEVFDDLTDHESLFDSLWRHFDTAKNWKLFDDALLCLADLSACGVRLGIASNFDSRLRSITHELRPLDGVAALFISSELGFRKPHQDFFRAIEKSFHLPGQRMLLVGDTPENDYHAARAAGWQALLLDRDDRHREIPAEDRLRSLAELAERLR